MTTSMPTPLEDPWADLQPAPHGAVSARRVNETILWHLYWGRDDAGKYLLVLRCAPGSSPRDRLPKLREIEVVLVPAAHEQPAQLIIRLLDSALKDVFLRLCLDIVANIEKCTTEPAAVSAAVVRTWRWFHLLRGGAGDRLSREEQKGLLGELLVLRKYLLPAVGAGNAVASWRGPSGAPQDFVHNKVAIESKTCGSQDLLIKISSEFQLELGSLGGLFLHVATADPVSESGDGTTLTEAVVQLRQLLGGDPAVLQRFEGLISAAGYRDDDDYAGDRWRLDERGIYFVSDAFPRLVATSLPHGIEGLRYSLKLTACAEHLVGPVLLAQELEV